MADDRHYVPGDNYILDDISGMKIRASRARIIPGGQTGQLAVAPERWEPQQPQDFVTGVRDDITVALSRPRQKNQFVVVGTFVVAPSAARSNMITVDSAAGFSPGATVQIMLDTGVNFIALLTGASGDVFTLGAPLPASVGSLYGDPIENSILLLTYSPLLDLLLQDSVGPLLLQSGAGPLLLQGG